MAAGSLAELKTQFEIAKRQNFLADMDYNEAVACADEVGRMLNALVASLGTKH